MEEQIRLIRLVRDNPVLYDTHHSDYTKVHMKEEIWNEIARHLNLSDGVVAKETWRKLRDSHRDALRRQTRKLNEGETKIKPWIYQKNMAFLVPHMTTKFIKGNEEYFEKRQNFQYNEELLLLDEMNRVEIKLEVDENHEEIDTYASDDDSNKRKHNVFNNTDIMPNYVKRVKGSGSELFGYDENEFSKVEKDNETQVDETESSRVENGTMYHFFMSMYNSTKDMPILSQINLRKKIFALVTEAEENLVPDKDL